MDEVVSFEVDMNPLQQSAKTGNAVLEGMEKKATNTGEVIVRTFDRSRASIERLTASIEKQAQTYGKSGIEKLISQRDQMVQRLGNEKSAVDRVIASYERMLDVERRQEQQKRALLAQQEQERALLTQQRANQQLGQNISNFAQNPIGAATGLLTNIGPIGAALAAIPAALTAIAITGFQAMKSLADFGTEIHNVQVRTGLTANEVVQFGYAARVSGQDVSIFERMMKGLTAALEDTSEKGGKARESLKGLSLRDATGELKPTSDILLEVSQRLNTLPNVFERNKVAIDLFKRAGIEAAPVILDLAENVKRAKDIGLGIGEAEVESVRAYKKELTEVELRWERFLRVLKTPLADLTDAVLQTILPGSAGSRGGPIGTPEAFRFDGSFGIRVDTPGAQGARGLSRVLAGGLEGAQARLKELKDVYDRERVTAKQLADTGLVLPELASKHEIAIRKAESAYRSQAETVKLIEKDETRRIATLERIRDLAREGDTAYIIGSGPLQTVVSGQELYSANQPIRRIPTLRNRSEQQAFDSAGSPVSGPLLPEGIQRIGVEEVFVSPSQSRGSSPEEVGLPARGAGFVENEQIRRARGLFGINAGSNYAERLVQIRAERDDEIQTARTVASIRQSALSEEFKLTGDIVSFREHSLENEVNMRLRIAEAQKQQYESIKGPASGLFNTLFTSPRSFGSQLGSTLRGAVLRPITEGLGGIAARTLFPLIFGAGGTGGIAGSLKHMFGGEKNDPVVVSNDLNTQATMENTAELRRFNSNIGMAAAGMGGGSGGLDSIFGGGPTGGLKAIFKTISGKHGLSDILKDLKGSLKVLSDLKDTFYNSSIQLGNGRATTPSGIGGFKGDLAGVLTSNGAAALYLAAGIPLAQAGLLGNSRGSWGGIAKGTLGGALTGAGIGTMIAPGIGTLIGAGVGAAVGFGIGIGEKLFGVEPQWREAERLVLEQYHVNINRLLGEQIASIANQNFRGHVSLAVMSPDVRRLIELYAAATGQRIPVSAATPRGASLVEQGGLLSQAPTYLFGTPYTFQSNLPVLGGSSATYPSSRTTAPAISAAPVSGSLTDLIGEVVSPGYVSAKMNAAHEQSDGRLRFSARIQQPGLLIS